MNTYKLIKETVEKVSEIKDLSMPNRERYVSDCRKVYFGLSRLYKRSAYHGTNCSKIVNRRHCSGIHNIKQFDDYIGLKSFTANDVYNDVRKILDPLLLHKVAEIEDDIEFTKSKIDYLENLLSEYTYELESLELRKASKMDVIYKAV